MAATFWRDMQPDDIGGSEQLEKLKVRRTVSARHAPHRTIVAVRCNSPERRASAVSEAGP